MASRLNAPRRASSRQRRPSSARGADESPRYLALGRPAALTESERHRRPRSSLDVPSCEAARYRRLSSPRAPPPPPTRAQLLSSIQRRVSEPSTEQKEKQLETLRLTARSRRASRDSTEGSGGRRTSREEGVDSLVYSVPEVPATSPRIYSSEAMTAAVSAAADAARKQGRELPGSATFPIPDTYVRKPPAKRVVNVSESFTMELKAKSMALDHDEPPKAHERLAEQQLATARRMEEASAYTTIDPAAAAALSARRYTSSGELAVHLQLLGELFAGGASGEAAALAANLALLKRSAPPVIREPAGETVMWAAMIRQPVICQPVTQRSQERRQAAGQRPSSASLCEHSSSPRHGRSSGIGTSIRGTCIRDSGASSAKSERLVSPRTRRLVNPTMCWQTDEEQWGHSPSRALNRASTHAIAVRLDRPSTARAAYHTTSMSRPLDYDH